MENKKKRDYLLVLFGCEATKQIGAINVGLKIGTINVIGAINVNTHVKEICNKLLVFAKNKSAAFILCGGPTKCITLTIVSGMTISSCF